MNTTAIFAEILAIGIQTTLVLGVGLASLVDLGGLVAEAQQWTALTSIAFVAIAYVAGVAVDRLADSLLGSVRNRVSRRTGLQYGEARRRILERSSPLASFLEYQRSRMRLMRGTVFNLALALPILNLALLNLTPLPPAPSFVVGNVAILGAVLACWYAYLQIGAAQDRWLQLTSHSPDPRVPERDNA